MKNEIKVWDPFVRVFHWTLVAGFFVAYFTEGERWLGVHVNAGYLVLLLVLARVVWGFIGSKYARFSQFAYSPARSIQYAVNVLKGGAPRFIGHNPAGALMIFILFFMLLATTVSGLMVYGSDQHAGPFKSFFAGSEEAKESEIVKDKEAKEEKKAGEDEAMEAREHEAAGGGEKEEDETEEFLEELHDILANLTVLLVVIHVLGVIVESIVHKENLARAMVTGRKRADGDSVA